MAENNENTLTANGLYFEDVEDEHGKALTLEESLENNLVALLLDRYSVAQSSRDIDEERWLTAYHNYRGLYGKHVRFRESEKSRVFVKVTKTKVLAAFGQLVDVVFGGNKFPIGVSETKMPEGVEEHANFNPSLESSAPRQEEDTATDETDNPFDVGYEGDGRVLKAGATYGSGNFEVVRPEKELDMQEGLSPIPQMLEVDPAQQAARRMEKLIHDQIEESSGSAELRSALFECSLFGTGIVKGPFNFNKTLNRWDENEEGERVYKPVDVRVPRIEFVSIWDFFPDPSATSMDEAEFIFHRHKLNRTQLRALGKMPYFNKDAIRECLTMGPNYVELDFESELRDEDASEEYSANQYEVLEYWGVMDAEYARQVGMDIPEDVDDLDEVQINAWIGNGKLLRAVVNPFTPFRVPYQAFPYERNPYSFFGIGVAENMDDSQQIMNGHARMAIDNLALSGSLVFDVDETALVGGQSMEIYPGKVFKRQAGVAGQAINGLKFPNTSTENMMMFDKFRQLADEQTGISSYSHGQTGVQSMTRTASGMSMLLGAASLNIKTVIKNLDEFLLKPLGEAFFQWNMQFLEKKLGVDGDLEVKATGTNSLMQKEVRSQRLTMFLQVASNQNLAPFVRWHSILSEIAKSLDIEPEKLINDPEKAAIFAKIMGMANGNQQTENNNQQSSMASNGGAPAGANPNDPTGVGGGNIGTGNIPQAGESGFSAGNTETEGTT